jgi:co-chaperonin GroES (HSP10)
VPENNVFDVGDTVLSIDKNNYTIKYQDKEYVKIMEHEIVGKILDKAS